ncbi:hypothetical protein [Hymenobacter actinosclerus]|uniref:Uncharacterized protein n=1 Tax=Hymenobacter actinosclerus TaxID=82805 RepID=A0A1I0H9J9_9BACT|nr:hypothetical protein [Hymenobacter actinosclerus]SET80350.1 hypothetical protein SAMN04487998_2823 [Hymenobacter actinosclerus]
MNIINPGLETFVDHNRADFDAFEPRPDLWEAIAQDLDAAPAAPALPTEPAPSRVLPLFPPAAPAALVGAAGLATDTTTAAVRSARPYGIAAAVATLLLLGTWAWQQPQAASWTQAGATTALPAEVAPELPPYTVPGLASPASIGPEQRLASAVQRMETYYAVQLAERQQELRQADEGVAANAPRADWQQELASLDEAYEQLKTELYQNPEPEMVLEAMNRNMQIRLDLLGQQLRTREQIREYHNQPYMVADSRRLP